jgi:hypothetical protein
MSDPDEPITDAELTRLEALLAEASPAPWASFVGPGIGGDDFIRIGEDDAEPDMYVLRDGKPASAADLDFIAAARNHLPALIAEARRARIAKSLRRDAAKQPFLVIDDYGTGGIWMYIYARSAGEITQHYPDLTVITDWRDWMTPDRLIPLLAGLGPEKVYDIDQPHGYLKRYGESRPPPAG